MPRLSIVGLGGQGIALLGLVIGTAATLSGKYASVHSSYGAEVRGGRVETRIIISDKPILNPYTDNIEIYFLLHKVGWRSVIPKTDEVKIVYADKDLAIPDEEPKVNIKFLPLNDVSIKNRVPINMVTLGYLIKMGVVNYDACIEALKNRGIFSESNIKAINIGSNI